MRIVLIGGGDLARQLAHYIQTYDKQAKVIGFVDDFAIKGEMRFDVKCLGKLSALPALYAAQYLDAAFLAIGYKNLRTRQALFDSLHSAIPFYTFVHPTAFIDSSAVLGVGCCIGPSAIIEQGVVLGPNVFLYGGVNISHDSEIGAHTFVAPSVVIAGFTKIGKRCFLGINTSVIERIYISDDVIIGAAALVLNDLTESGLYVGAPARKK